MLKHSLRLSVAVMFSFALIGCATHTQKPLAHFDAIDVGSQSGFVQKVDSFLVVLDASSSMDDTYKDGMKVDLAKEIASRMNQTISSLSLMGALRTFGQEARSTNLVYGMSDYSSAGFEKALLPVWPGGGSPLDLSINAANGDLSSAKGQIAVIIISDGVGMDSAPIAAARNMKSIYGDRVCIHTVLVGDNDTGKRILEQIAGASQCGFSENADSIYSSQGMANFAEKVFLARAPDSDGDGVVDALDKCPNTPKGDKVNSDGCPLDSDGDGVLDHLDNCPNTPKGAEVNKMGCWIIKGLLFDTSKSDIKSKFYPLLDEVVNILVQNPSLKLEIQGHTDTRGTMEYNEKLSDNRAAAVMSHLVSKGIAKGRLTSKGLGFIEPVASNTTPEGMAQNRRVELKPIH
ncbi:hypothetical protein MNBD_GAMMA26-135 [hydrothermal vent metagenome]|uniref:Cell envelope biogenesis protein OmpA n=1 Tax=hydrothermal vent metagenome TaxID=652676 RepID=A0A3B1BG73_9ZZZZ